MEELNLAIVVDTDMLKKVHERLLRNFNAAAADSGTTHTWNRMADLAEQILDSERKLGGNELILRQVHSKLFAAFMVASDAPQHHEAASALSKQFLAYQTALQNIAKSATNMFEAQQEKPSAAAKAAAAMLAAQK